MGGAGMGGTGGAGSGGTAGEGGGTLMCTAETTSGSHSHPLTIPPEDVERGYADGPYTLEDGGTGHTHTVELSAYDFIFLAGGYAVMPVSSEDNGHTHDCLIECTSE
jgi:hypothetical protein